MKKYFNDNDNSPVSIVFLLYFAFLSVFVFTYIIIMHKDPVFFLNDDGYANLGKYYFEGRISLSHLSRNPGLIFLFSFFNYFPESLHPFLRLFKNLLSKRQLLIGLLISVFNPVYLHFTIKSTPEVYLTFFIGLIIFFYMKYINDLKIRYLVYAIFFSCIAMLFKPVFFAIPVFLFLHGILIKKLKYLFIPTIIFSVTVLISFFLATSFTKPLDEQFNYITVENIVTPTYLPKAILQTKQLNLGTREEDLTINKENSNYLIVMDSYYNWLNSYQKKNNNYSDASIILDFIKDNYFMFFLVKIISPITFISLSSSTKETVMNLFLNIFLIVLCIASIKKIYKEHKNDILIILCVILGYSFAFFLSASYIRYSLPFVFYFFPFSGILINNFLENKIFKKKQ